MKDITPKDWAQAQARADRWRDWLDRNGTPAASFNFGPVAADDSWPVATSCLLSALAARGLQTIALSSAMIGTGVTSVIDPHAAKVPLLLGTITVLRMHATSPPALDDTDNQHLGDTSDAETPDLRT